MEKLEDWEKLCDSCIHRRVCKHCEEWKQYCKEHYEMRKYSSLFDCSPRICTEYRKDKPTLTFTNDDLILKCSHEDDGISIKGGSDIHREYKDPDKTSKDNIYTFVNNDKQKADCNKKNNDFTLLNIKKDEKINKEDKKLTEKYNKEKDKISNNKGTEISFEELFNKLYDYYLNK